jgi:hypothetical protein
MKGVWSVKKRITLIQAKDEEPTEEEKQAATDAEEYQDYQDDDEQFVFTPSTVF